MAIIGAISALLLLLLSCSGGDSSTVEPTLDSFVFTAVGDYGSGGDVIPTLDAIARSGAAFHIALGDLAYTPAPETVWCDLVKSRVGADFPFTLTTGNHEEDEGGDGNISRFAACLPNKVNGQGKYPEQYYFDYGGLARMIVISPNMTIDGTHYFYGENNENYRWMAARIDEARKAKIPWVIVAMHTNCISVGEYYCNVYQELWNLLVDKKVDLVLQANDHNYQRSRQIATNNGCKEVTVDEFSRSCVIDDGEDGVYKKGDGLISVVVGTAGAELYPIHTDDPEAGYFARWMGANVMPRKGFLKLNLTKSEMTAEFIGTTNTSNFTDKFVIRN